MTKSSINSENSATSVKQFRIEFGSTNDNAGDVAMRSDVRGMLWCFSFVILEALQAVFFGGVFQKLDSFLIGTSVFGIAALASIGWTCLRGRSQLAIAFRNLPALAGLNVTAAGGWIAYLISIQLIEPATAFALFSGAVPITMAAARFRSHDIFPLRSRLEVFGNLLICAGMAALALFTLYGWSGFVRGGMPVAVIGLALAVTSGAFIAGMLLYSRKLDGKGVGPVAQFGLRFLLYLPLSALGYWFGVDSKGPAPMADIAYAIVIGLVVMALPIYATQKAVSLASSATIGAITALGPLFVFAFQSAEGRIAYSEATLAGLFIYFLGAMIAVTANMRAGFSARSGAT